LPHFDKFMGRMPDLLLRPFLRPKEGMRIVGIDEDTALVSPGDGHEWSVWGRSKAWLLDGGHREGIAVGTTISL